MKTIENKYHYHVPKYNFKILITNQQLILKMYLLNVSKNTLTFTLKSKFISIDITPSVPA